MSFLFVCVHHCSSKVNNKANKSFIQSLTEWVEEQRLECGRLISSSLVSRKNNGVMIEMWFCETKDDDYLVKNYGYTSSLGNWLQLAWESI